MQESRKRVTYANVMSTIALVAALGGGTAFAATKLITGKDVKDASLTGADVKNGSLAAADLSAAAKATLKGAQGPAGPAGAAGPTGPAGPAGAAGVAGRSALSVLTTGETISGGANIDTTAATGGEDFRTWVPFPMAAPAAPTVVLATADATCTGTVDAPTAPAGKVCVYVGATSTGETVNAFAGESSTGTTSRRVGTAASRRGFLIEVQSGEAGDVFVSASWAYTAP